jgi:hypothetical protein
MKKLLFILLFTPLLCIGQENSKALQNEDFTTQLSLLQKEVQVIQRQQEKLIMRIDRTQRTYYFGVGLAIAGSVMSSIIMQSGDDALSPLLTVGIAASIGGGLTSLFAFRNLAKHNTRINYNSFK